MVIGSNYSTTTGTSYASVKDYCWPEENGTYTCTTPIYSDNNLNGWYDTGEEKAVSLIVDGNVGIGTANPKRKLEVDAGLDDNPLEVRTSRNINASALLHLVHNRGVSRVVNGDSIALAFRADSNTTPSAIVSYIKVFSEDVTHADRKSAIAFWTEYGETIREVMRINGEGNVGIGTTTPASYAALDVNTSSNKSIHTMDNANGGLLIGYAGSNIQARTTADANSQNLILQRWGGNVGIGTTNPGATLEVKGTVSIMRRVTEDTYNTDTSYTAPTDILVIVTVSGGTQSATPAIEDSTDGIAYSFDYYGAMQINTCLIPIPKGHIWRVLRDTRIPTYQIRVFRLGI
jgi:hypothetical protein